ncbi:hypothetical protein ABES03_00215 [Neobacillus rhizosphaerae]|uniref:hypothetical protein n=1 Tax=Neobacillus rhizosphaerae TaxID=2880965 RepID=UPI003D2885F6
MIQEGLKLIFVEINTQHRTAGLLVMELGVLAYGKMIYLYTLIILIKREVILI